MICGFSSSNIELGTDFLKIFLQVGIDNKHVQLIWQKIKNLHLIYSCRSITHIRKSDRYDEVIRRGTRLI